MWSRLHDVVGADATLQRWEDDTHATDEVVIVLGGTMEFEVKGQIHRPKPGAELFIPAGTMHSVRNIGRTTAQWLFGYRIQ